MWFSLSCVEKTKSCQSQLQPALDIHQPKEASDRRTSDDNEVVVPLDGRHPWLRQAKLVVERGEENVGVQAAHTSYKD